MVVGTNAWLFIEFYRYTCPSEHTNFPLGTSDIHFFWRFQFSSKPQHETGWSFDVDMNQLGSQVEMAHAQRMHGGVKPTSNESHFFAEILPGLPENLPLHRLPRSFRPWPSWRRCSSCTKTWAVDSIGWLSTRWVPPRCLLAKAFGAMTCVSRRFCETTNCKSWETLGKYGLVCLSKPLK